MGRVKIPSRRKEKRGREGSLKGEKEGGRADENGASGGKKREGRSTGNHLLEERRADEQRGRERFIGVVEKHLPGKKPRQTKGPGFNTI